MNKELFKQAIEICKGHEATISFTYSEEGSEVDVHRREIIIDLEEVPNIRMFWSLVFHELAHIWCWDNDVYTVFHGDTLSDKEMARYMRAYGLKVERRVDEYGARMMNEIFPKMTFEYSYKGKEGKKWFDNWVEKTYPLK